MYSELQLAHAAEPATSLLQLSHESKAGVQFGVTTDAAFRQRLSMSVEAIADPLAVS
jgi:hypothetical protein